MHKPGSGVRIPLTLQDAQQRPTRDHGITCHAVPGAQVLVRAAQITHDEAGRHGEDVDFVAVGAMLQERDHVQRRLAGVVGVRVFGRGCGCAGGRDGSPVRAKLPGARGDVDAVRFGAAKGFGFAEKKKRTEFVGHDGGAGDVGLETGGG